MFIEMTRILHSKFLWIVALLFGIMISTVHSIGGIKAVSVFRNDEIMYHKYSAVLAAAEPFRLQLENEIQLALSPLSYFFRRIKGSFAKPLATLRYENAEVDSACQRYEKRIDDIVRSYGLSTDIFNALSQKISKESNLRQRVLLQAYYYRIAADLELNIRQELPVLPSVSTSGRILKFSPSDSDEDYKSSIKSEPQITRFCKTLRTIEFERLKQRENLQNSLGLRVLPERMCDPDVFPAMTKEIQHACVSFTSKANTIIAKHDISPDEFNMMQEKLKRPGLFRFRVERELNRLEKEVIKSKNNKEQE